MIKHMFVFGVILPTLVTVIIFVAFLVCWFKFNVHERLFSKRKLFSKQIKHAMAPSRQQQQQPSSTKQNNANDHIYTTDNSMPPRPGTGAAATGASKGTCASNQNGGSFSGILSRSTKPRRYENCISSTAVDEDDLHEHSVGDDPEAALCMACEDEAEHRRANMAADAGFTNPNLCASPTHSAHADDEGGDDDDDDDVVMDEEDKEVARCRQQMILNMHKQRGDLNMVNKTAANPALPTYRLPEHVPCRAPGCIHPHLPVTTEHQQVHTDTEGYHTDDVDDADVQYVQVKQIGSMFQHTFHFPASECSHLSNSLVPGDSEDALSEDNMSNAGSNYGHFVPLSQLLRDPKARHKFYSSVSRDRADSPASGGEFCEGNAGEAGQRIGVGCSETGRLILNNM